MKTHLRHLALLAASAIAACASDAPETETGATETEQAAMVENAVRRAYENEGAEVVDIAMERSPDGSRFDGTATVRDPATGEQIDVTCSYSQGPGGQPSLDCTRGAAEAEAPVVIPSD